MDALESYGYVRHDNKQMFSKGDTIVSISFNMDLVDYELLSHLIIRIYFIESHN